MRTASTGGGDGSTGGGGGGGGGSGGAEHFTAALNGAPFSGATLEGFNWVTYSQTYLSGESDAGIVILYLGGATAGTSHCGSGARPYVFFRTQSGGYNDRFDSTMGSTCTISVANYGEVGQHITGTFSATLGAYDGGTLVVTNGSFDVVRGPDQ